MARTHLSNRMKMEGHTPSPSRRLHVGSDDAGIMVWSAPEEEGVGGRGQEGNCVRISITVYCYSDLHILSMIFDRALSNQSGWWWWRVKIEESQGPSPPLLCFFVVQPLR